MRWVPHDRPKVSPGATKLPIKNKNGQKSLSNLWKAKSPKIWIYVMFRVRFNDSWFVFHDSSWGFHEPILVENSEIVNRTQVYVLKTCSWVPNYSAMS